MAFRLLNNFPVYLGLTGLPASGGELRFYDSGTTTPRDVFGDPALTINNGSTVEIGSDGRTVVDVWGEGSYRVRLYAFDGTLIDEADNVEVAGGDAAAIPALVDGWFLTNNGSLLLWAEIRQLPDPTGQDGKMVIADGNGYILQPIPDIPEPPAPDIVVEANRFQAGISSNTSKWVEATGSGSAAAGGGKTATASITFGTPFTVTPTFVDVVPTTASAGATANLIPRHAITSVSPTGFTVTFSTITGGTSADDHGGSNLIGPVAFMWKATGLRTVA